MDNLKVEYKGSSVDTKKHSNIELFSSFMDRYGTIFLVILIFLIFGFTSSHFFEPENILNIFKQISIVAIISIGMTIVILIRGIDLSSGSIVLLSSVICGGLLTGQAVNAVVAILAGLTVAVLVGFINGIFIEKAKIDPVIVTLGTMMAIKGLAQIILGKYGHWIWIKDPLLVYTAQGKVVFLPVIVIIMFALYILAYFMMGRTSFGKYIYAIGGNEKAAYLCGIGVVNVKIAAYMLSGLCAGIAGILVSARMGCINSVLGDGFAFDAVTAVILGGTSLKGGSGRVEKTILGAIIVGLILNYLTIKGISPHYQKALTGFVILLAALLDRLTHGRTE